jgi:hypothetical protein
MPLFLGSIDILLSKSKMLLLVLSCERRLDSCRIPLIFMLLKSAADAVFTDTKI